MSIQEELIKESQKLGAEIIHFADISHLPADRNQNFPRAIILGVTLSPGYLKNILTIPDYISKMIANNQMKEDEFDLKEIFMDQIADTIATFLNSKGYAAFSQSEKNTIEFGFYQQETKTSNLPHKTIARIANLGWIGKNDLLITPEYGCAICVSTVLTNAPLKTPPPAEPDSQCGNCTICQNCCPVNAISGKQWSTETKRDDLINVYKCTTCLRCLAFCPHTQSYINKNS
jgi:epoxyqueuosine reductase